MSTQVGSTLRDERGLSVLEVLIATALIIVAALGGLTACKTIAQVLRASTAAQSSGSGMDAAAARLQNDAATALAVFAPGTPAGEPAQEVDFYTKADDGRAVFWCYAYDPAAQTLRRWDIDADGARGVRDVVTGAVDAAARYPALEHVTRFAASPIAADRLDDAAANVYAGVGALFARTPQALPVRYAGTTPAGSDVVGGNGVVQITLADATAARVVHLAAGSMPSGFTVNGALVWHAVVYRVDQSHRFLLGAAGKSHVFINARVDVSYDGWKTRTQWCDFNLLGNPDGLASHDPHADYKPNESIESSGGIIAGCLARHPRPPDRGAPDNPSDADAVHPPLAGQTPPACWSRPGPGGRCWPADAPPDWSPPSPFPAETAPPAWCAGHARSPVCAPGPGTATAAQR